MGDFGEVRRWFRAAGRIGAIDYASAIADLESSPLNPENRFMIALCHEWSGDRENARVAAQEVLDLEPDHFGARA